jgi:antibiotic biosynthesis monooxygenase (ABM) superfamily enzyme
LAAAAPFIEGQALIRQVSGLAHWFLAPIGPKQEAPLRWKVAVVTWVGIFPTVYFLFFALGNLLAPWSLLPRIMFLTVLVVGLMTWVVAPQLTRIFKPLLYPTAKT